MTSKYKKHEIFIFGCLLWDIICRPMNDPNKGDDNVGDITESPRKSEVSYTFSFSYRIILPNRNTNGTTETVPC